MPDSQWFWDLLTRAIRSGPASFVIGALVVLVAGVLGIVTLPRWTGFISGGPFVIAPQAELNAAQHWEQLAATRQRDLDAAGKENVRLTAAVNNRALQLRWCSQHDELIASLRKEWHSLNDEIEQRTIRDAPVVPSLHPVEDAENDPLIRGVVREQDSVMSQIGAQLEQEKATCNFGASG